MDTDPRLASALLHADVERLKAQVQLSSSKEIAALRRVGLRDGMAILEVGGGPGFFSEVLLSALPLCTVTSVELDAEMCAVAANRLKDDLGVRLTIEQASILLTDLEAESFDFAVARLVFQHLAAPDLALLEILRLLKPGAWLVMVDVDDDLGGLLVPHSDAFDLVGRRMAEVQAARGGDRRIGRKLWGLLERAGFVEPRLDTVLVHSDELGLEPFLLQYQPARYRPFVMADGLGEDEWASYREAYDRFVSTPEAYILQLLMLASGKKPRRNSS